ncbi:transposase [Desulfonatronum parangueonense]
MCIVDYEKLILSENNARRYLLKFCWKNHQRFCPRCRQRRNYPLTDGRRRCAQCAYTYHDFTGRWINNCDLKCREWLRLIKLFELDLTVLAMTKEMGLAYNTVYKAITTIRCAIAANAIDARDFFGAERSIELKTSGRVLSVKPCSNLTTPVFGVIEHSGMAFVDLVSGLHPETVFHFHQNFGLRLGHWGKTYFSAPYQRYHALLFCSHQPPPRFMEFGLTPEHGEAGKTPEFLGYLLDNIRRYRGLSPEKFPLYVKELEARYNNRDQDIFEMTASLLCRFVPKFA